MYLPLFFNEILLLVQELVLIFLNFFKFFLTLRLTMNWFPNCNPFVQPFFFLTRITDPYLRLFRGFAPTTFGLDFSPMLAITWIECVTEVVLTIN